MNRRLRFLIYSPDRLKSLHKQAIYITKACIMIVFGFVCLQNLYSQNNTLDSILYNLETSYDTAQFSHLIRQTTALSEIDNRQAEMYALQALDLCKSNMDNNGIATTYTLLGNINLQQFDYTKAKNYFEHSIKYYSILSNYLEIANCRNNLGTVYEKLGEYNKALEQYLYAFELYKELDNKIGLAATCNNLGVLYYMLDQPEKSINFYAQALLILDSLQDRINLKNTIANIGAVHFNQYEYDSAIHYFNECYKIEETLLDTTGMGKTLNSIGRVYMARGKITTALTHFNKALEFSIKVMDYSNICSIYENLGLISIQQENIKVAEKYFDSCYAIASEQNLIEQLKSIYLRKAELYEKTGEFKKAYKFYRRFEEIKSSILIEQNLVTETEALFLKQKQENRILRLEKEQEKKKNQVIILISALIILVVFTGAMLIIHRISKKRLLEKAIAERQKEQFKAVLEAQEKERKRIAGDLHDSVGQILSITKLNISELVDLINLENDEEKELVERSLKLIDDACQEVRDISHNLMPGTLIRLGFVSATKELIRKIKTKDNFQIHLNAEEDIKRFDEKIEFALYRILQEILNNAIKHSQSSMINIDIQLKSETLILQISDNGIGFDTKKIDLSQGIGWKNIYSRLSMINGNIKVHSEINKGTQITIKIPV